MRSAIWVSGVMVMVIVFGAASAEEVSYFDATRTKMEALAQGKLNKLESFTPRIYTADYLGERHTPLVAATMPWDRGDELCIEVPEYAWAEVPGDKHSGAPFYFGRRIGHTKKDEWVVRYPSKEEPTWKEMEGGGLALDNPLEGGYVVRFRVIPYDRMIEVRFGITNGSEKPLMNLRCQLCAKPHKIKSMSERWPTEAKLFADGEVISWDGAGQELSWLNRYRRPDGSFRQSCFFLAPTKDHVPENWERMERQKGSLMWLDRLIDVPAIAKCDKNEKRFLIVYSPFGRRAFYNVNFPCFHADPYMKRILPGETRWTTSYYVMFNGDLKAFFEKLAEVHEGVKREDGVE